MNDNEMRRDYIREKSHNDMLVARELNNTKVLDWEEG